MFDYTALISYCHSTKYYNTTGLAASNSRGINTGIRCGGCLRQLLTKVDVKFHKC
eukprot:Awhi_evm1s4259